LRNGFLITKLFSPEHGIASQGMDGKVQPHGVDYLTQLPVVSLYNNSVIPQLQDLNDVEIVLIDLPNIGCRFYTYWWTITHMIEACSLAHKKIILLDRPNMSERKPLSMEGPLLDDKNCSSFLGRWSMPLTYGYTYGQLTQWFVHDHKINVEMEIVPCHQPLKTIFVPPSPAINDLQSIWAYPCTGLFEGLNINYGRGTTFPFRVIGAPWINSIQFHKDFRERKFDGVESLPYSYLPVDSTYANQICHGLYFTINDKDMFKPVKTGIWLMNYLSIHYAQFLKPQLYPTAVNPEGKNHLDLLLGVSNSFDTFCTGNEISEQEIEMLLNVKGWVRQIDEFLNQHQR
jgi:uncharacterized protein YbbC (DUF1343 family)